MMESCLNNKADTREQVEVDDLKRDLSSEFSPIPDLQHSSIEEREHLQVYLRIRPFSSEENNNGESQDCVTIESPDTVLLRPPRLSLSARLSADKSLPQTGQRFQFSQVFGPETMQKELFQGTVKDLVKEVLEGGNSLVFTYGVTNAGKTFTFLGPDADAGVLPRSLQVIFSSIEEQVFTEMSVKPQRCREFTKLTREQQIEEVTYKRNFFSQFKESEKSNSSLLNSTNKTLLEGSSTLGMTVEAGDKISLAVEPHTKFSVWVSFCEIYNENIHDLLEVTPNGATRRTALRLSQDVKGNAFVRDLRWIQVSSAEEAYKVMKLGKKNQSFSSTRLNQLSSRSHSIFSIRVLRIEDIGSLRVHAVSELCLCDLAGSERCAKTQNRGERLKEAGNINTSLLILGKCINALRHNQQAKLLQHVPFRESKLTHYLQSFFRGRGKACMIVNINQCASMYDETLNVLKFSAVAQKVVVLSTRPPPIVLPERSAGEISFIINNAETKTARGSRRSSVIGWDTSLEDVQEDEDDEYEEENSLMEVTMDQTAIEEEADEKNQRHLALLKQLQMQLKKERAESLLMEARLREEISREFSEIFSEMQIDYNNRLARESDILEERAERRMEIFKGLMDKMARAGPSLEAQDWPLDSHSPEMEGPKQAAEPPRARLGSVRAEAQGERGETASGLEREEKRRLLSELQEKSLEIDRLEKQVRDLQKLPEEGSSREEERLQQAIAVEKEKRARAESCLDHRTLEREEALASLQEEIKAKEEALAKLRELQQSKEEVQASLGEEREGNKKATAALEAERRAKEASMAAHSEEKQCRLDIIAALGRERSSKEEAQSALKAEREKRQQETDALRQEVRALAARLEASEHQVTSSTERAEHVLIQQQTAQAQLDKCSIEVLEKASQIHTLTHEVQSLKQELRTSATSSDAVNDQLTEEVSAPRIHLAEEKEKNESKDRIMLEFHHQLDCQENALEALVNEWRAKREEPTLYLENFKINLEEQKAEAQQQDKLDYEAILSKQKENLCKLQHLLLKVREQDQAEKLKAELEETNSSSSAAKEDLKRLNSDLQTEIASLKLKLCNMEETRCKTEAQLASSEFEKALKENNKRMEEKLAEAAKVSAELQEKLLEKAAEAASLQKRLDKAQEQREEEEMQAVQEARRREVEKLKGILLQQDRRGNATHLEVDTPSDDLKLAKQETAQVQESLKLCAEKHQAERKKWLEEKLSLIGQAKEAEDKRNQEMRKFAENRERHARQQSQLESTSSQLAEKEQTMEKWRKERDALVAALEVQLQKLLSSQAEKDKLIQQLRQNDKQPPQECDGAGDGVRVAELQAALCEREAQILRLKEELQAFAATQDAGTQIESHASPAALVGKPQCDTINRKSGGRRETRASVSSQGSAGFPSVLESSEISTENGRTSRFPRPEMEISFSPLQPNRMALRRQGEESAVTIKITRSARKRKSGEMEKEEMEAENKRNTRTKLTPKLTPHQEERSSPAGRHDSKSSIRSRKEGTLQKIGDFLQGSPTLLGSKAKKMMSLVSGRGDAASSSSLSLRAKKNKKKLYRPEISSPMDMPPHPIISREPEEKESDHHIIKRRLRSRLVK
uniref:Kinesin family member 20Ba n=1 Tax=Gasterosteus aculeatus aculeatus TaxID=481459 RepID=A0AAQ4R9N2_GASAC